MFRFYCQEPPQACRFQLREFRAMGQGEHHTGLRHELLIQKSGAVLPARILLRVLQPQHEIPAYRRLLSQIKISFQFPRKLENVLVSSIDFEKIAAAYVIDLVENLIMDFVNFLLDI